MCYHTIIHTLSNPWWWLAALLVLVIYLINKPEKDACRHAWGEWKTPYEVEFTIQCGSFGGTAKDHKEVQERICLKCGKVDSVYVRGGRRK